MCIEKKWKDCTETKKKALCAYYDAFVEEVDQLFLRKFEELSDLNIGEGEITRIVGRLVNAKANMIDQVRGWLLRLKSTRLFFLNLSKLGNRK